MNILISFILSISIFVVSFYSMVWGWGIEPENMGWIIASYIWVFFAGGIGGLLQE